MALNQLKYFALNWQEVICQESRLNQKLKNIKNTEIPDEINQMHTVFSWRWNMDEIDIV